MGSSSSLSGVGSRKLIFVGGGDLDGIPVALLTEVTRPVSKNSGRVSRITYIARPVREIQTCSDRGGQSNLSGSPIPCQKFQRMAGGPLNSMLSLEDVATGVLGLISHEMRPSLQISKASARGGDNKGGMVVLSN